MSYAKPLPVPDSETQEFWEGCRHGKLMLQRCTQCGTKRFPPTRFCYNCRSAEQEWVESPGRARVFSWIVVRHPVPREVYGGDVPYVVALVQLDEGVRMPSNIVNVMPEAMEADMRVRVVFRAVTPEITLPLFEPDREP